MYFLKFIYMYLQWNSSRYLDHTIRWFPIFKKCKKIWYPFFSVNYDAYFVFYNWNGYYREIITKLKNMYTCENIAPAAIRHKPQEDTRNIISSIRIIIIIFLIFIFWKRFSTNRKIIAILLLTSSQYSKIKNFN